MKTALITGASGGIGFAVVKKFIENGYFVVAQYNKGAAEIERLSSELKERGLADYLFPFRCDFTDSDSVKELLSYIEINFKRLDVLVNNAGMDYYALSVDTPEEIFDKIFAVNVKSAFTLSNYAVKGMRMKGFGRIINVSSVWGVKGACMESVYSASKFALGGFTKSLAQEVASDGITVNCVCPGVTDTKMNDRFSEEEKSDIVADIPVGRICKAEEIADVIFFLTGKEADYITGQNIVVDGGFTL